MKIAFIGQKGIPAHGGGIERYAEDLSVRLVKNGHQVIVYIRPHYTSKNKTSYNGVELVSLPTIKTKHLDAIIHTILVSVDVLRRNVDIVHYQNIGPALVCWLPKLFDRNLKVVSTLQSRDYQHQKWGKFAKSMLKLGELLMCKFSDEIIVITENMQKYVKAKYKKSAHLIPNGANFHKNIKACEIKKWGLAQGNYIVTISRLVRHKGIQYLITAYKELNTNKKLIIAGEGVFTDDYVKELKKLAGDDPRIIFIGNQTGKTLAELYSNAYLFVQPSESEGLSLALLEAMSYGQAVLVSDIHENKEAVGNTGFIFKNKDVEDLRNKLIYLLKHPGLIKNRGEQGREKVRKLYNWDDITENIIKVYQ